nr:uncharacterized protein LOC106691154 [Halyomorpha halys]
MTSLLLATCFLLTILGSYAQDYKIRNPSPQPEIPFAAPLRDNDEFYKSLYPELVEKNDSGERGRKLIPTIYDKPILNPRSYHKYDEDDIYERVFAPLKSLRWNNGGGVQQKYGIRPRDLRRFPMEQTN